MKELVLPDHLVVEIEQLFIEMEREYDRVAKELGFSCEGCPDNCCDSHFQHHTYVEWAYLWLGLSKLDQEARKSIEERAAENLKACNRAEASGERPQVMCPLNEGGLCALYKYRMLVCRTHGVPAAMRRPDGQVLRFPGCFRCQEIVEEKKIDTDTGSFVERTPLLQRLVAIENEFLEQRRHMYPRVKMTISEMIIKGPPAISTPHCERR